MKFSKESFYQFWLKSWTISFFIFVLSFLIFGYLTYFLLNIFYPLAFFASAFVANLNVIYLQNFRLWHFFGLLINRYSIKHFVIGFSLPFIFFLPILLFLLPFGLEIQRVDVFKILTTGFFQFFSASTEELIFRGVLFQRLVERKGNILAIFLFSIFFAVLHLFNPYFSFIALLNLFLASILLSIMFIRTYMLWLPIGFHFGWNFWQAFLLSSPVSGMNFEIGIFNTKITIFNELIFGGSFGIEGGVCSTIIITFTIWLVAKYFIPVPEVYSRVLREKYTLKF